MRPATAALLCAWLCLQVLSTQAAQPIRVASKTFTESYILAEITAQLLESDGLAVQREIGLGGTLIAFEALRGGAIDVYPDYTGTLTQAVLQSPGLSAQELARRLAEMGLVMQVPLGFDNSYAIALLDSTAQARGIERISDLAQHPQLRAGFSHEFLNRADGWPALRAAYDLPQQPVGLEHALAYGAIESGGLDFTDAYTTDGELAVRDLRLLRDDRDFFPRYRAVLLTRSDLPQAAARSMQKLANILDEKTMQGLNHRVADGGESPGAVAAAFLREAGLVAQPAYRERSRAQRIADNTLAHLRLTGTALLLACLVAIPLALWLSRYERLARGLLYVTGLVQTIPALALLALLIPLVGLGELPAILALFLYSLLPIVRNTLTGLFSIDPLLRQVATGMGLTYWQRIRRIELPLAMPTLLAGVKTAAIISIGTATLAAFVGAGGLGEPIITGLNLNDNRLILEGAIPAALLAVAAELAFELLERSLIPAHLRN
ncbi:MAG: ABC transporter permease [Halioglobus sp.]|nr:ABC transporter permease [Halioglobus sp.]